MYKILAIMGKAGSGKDTLARNLDLMYPEKFHKILSATTRPKRENEQEGIDYAFVSDHEFADLLDEEAFLECSSFRGWHYGSLIKSLVSDRVNIGVFNLAGVRALMDSDLELKVIYLRAPAKERLLRQLYREENPDCMEICRRFRTDEEDFADTQDIEMLSGYECWDNNKPEDLDEILRALGRY